MTLSNSPEVRAYTARIAQGKCAQRADIRTVRRRNVRRARHFCLMAAASQERRARKDRHRPKLFDLLIQFSPPAPAAAPRSAGCLRARDRRRAVRRARASRRLYRSASAAMIDRCRDDGGFSCLGCGGCLSLFVLVASLAFFAVAGTQTGPLQAIAVAIIVAFLIGIVALEREEGASWSACPELPPLDPQVARDRQRTSGSSFAKLAVTVRCACDCARSYCLATNRPDRLLDMPRLAPNPVERRMSRFLREPPSIRLAAGVSSPQRR